jgi:hypothetical protein
MPKALVGLMLAAVAIVLVGVIARSPSGPDSAGRRAFEPLRPAFLRTLGFEFRAEPEDLSEISARQAAIAAARGRNEKAIDTAFGHCTEIRRPYSTLFSINQPCWIVSLTADHVLLSGPVGSGIRRPKQLIVLIDAMTADLLEEIAIPRRSHSVP